ncbi:IMP dehydrogenase [Verrucomicrobia bacterium]|nr:IMP dehydrogenase [Verrucomicrobiota bacterium]MDA7533613.1 IMP dehydrogenase [Verrucomicrobiota bacterium]MDB4350550.1 IMP dehydrogenase [Verrucomicrobiota bacterium]MDC0266508.1 IMP dehydrogenase [bacterium]
MVVNQEPNSLDCEFYLQAENFFSANRGCALTYDDLTLATLYSEVLPRDTQLETSLSEGLNLHLPMISADMDTVTESRMAIAMAQNGGMGLIHYNMSEKDQLREVSRVKNHVHGLIQDPITVHPEKSIAYVLGLIDRKGFTFSTFPVVDEHGKLVGLLPGSVVRLRYSDRLVKEALTPRDQVFTLTEKELGNDPIARADQFFADHPRIDKLMVVDDADRLRGLFTLSDVDRIAQEVQAQFKPARDEQFRLICGAAVSATRNAFGELDSDRVLGHVTALVERGVDAVAVSTAHGHTQGVGEAVKLIRKEFPHLPIIAGNVTSGAGVEFLADCGANCIKVGQGPGSICTTRIVAGVGIPQMSALYLALQAARKKGVSILADGGISKSGDIVKALTLADAVICGGLLAGCAEAPGEILEISGKLYKQYRGMGSLAAMKSGSAARYGHSSNDTTRKVSAEGVEALKEVSGPVDNVLGQLIGGIQSGMGYLGARSLPELRKRARYIRVSPAGQRESATHDIVELKTGAGQ